VGQTSPPQTISCGAATSAIIVVDDTAHRPVGVITESNVDHWPAIGNDPNEPQSADISPNAPLSAESAASVRDAAMAMLLHHGVRYLPVVNDGRLVGIVSVHDLWPQLAPTTETRCDHDK
jgi:CBS domain-containing protein